MRYDREYVLDLLHCGVCNLVYEKLDGTVTHREGTLNAHYIPVRPNLRISVPANVIRYYDSYSGGGWCSFYLDKLQSIELQVDRTYPRSEPEEEAAVQIFPRIFSDDSSGLADINIPQPKQDYVGGGGTFDGGGASASWESKDDQVSTRSDDDSNSSNSNDRSDDSPSSDSDSGSSDSTDSSSSSDSSSGGSDSGSSDN